MQAAANDPFPADAKPSDGGLYLTAEQIALAPKEVQRWLRRMRAESESVQAQRVPAGEPQFEDGLAICGGAELKLLLRKLSDDFVACQVLFCLGYGFEPAQEAAARAEILPAAHFLHHTDVENRLQLRTCLETINQLVRQARSDRRVSLCRAVGNDAFQVHNVTRRRICRIWHRLAAVAERRAGAPIEG